MEWSKKHRLTITAFISVSIIGGAICTYRSQFGTVLSDSREQWGQFGDFLNVFVSMASLVLLAAITWFVYDNQKKDKEVEEERIKQQQTKERLTFLSHLISRSIRFTSELSQALTNFQNQLNTSPDPTNIPSVDYPPENDIKMLIDKVGQDELYYTAYTSRLKDNNFLPIISGFNAILGNYTSYKESLSNSKKQDAARKIEFYDLMEKIITELVKKNYPLPSNSPHKLIYKNSIDQYFGILSEERAIDIMEFRLNVIRPVAQHLESLRLHMLPENEHLFQNCLRANKLITQITTLNKRLGPFAEKINTYNSTAIGEIESRYKKLTTYLVDNGISVDYE